MNSIEYDSIPSYYICYTIYNSYDLLYLFTVIICTGLDFLDNGSIFEHAITCAGNALFSPSYDNCGCL